MRISPLSGPPGSVRSREPCPSRDGLACGCVRPFFASLVRGVAPAGLVGGGRCHPGAGGRWPGAKVLRRRGRRPRCVDSGGGRRACPGSLRASADHRGIAELAVTRSRGTGGPGRRRACAGSGKFDHPRTRPTRGRRAPSLGGGGGSGAGSSAGRRGTLSWCEPSSGPPLPRFGRSRRAGGRRSEKGNTREKVTNVPV